MPPRDTQRTYRARSSFTTKPIDLDPRPRPAWASRQGIPLRATNSAELGGSPRRAPRLRVGFRRFAALKRASAMLVGAAGFWFMLSSDWYQQTFLKAHAQRAGPRRDGRLQLSWGRNGSPARCEGGDVWARRSASLIDALGGGDE